MAEAVEAAKGPAPGALTVRVGREGDDLVVEVDGAGDAPFVHLSDRIGALGGRITIGGTTPASGDPMRVVVAEDVMLTREGIVRLLA